MYKIKILLVWLSVVSMATATWAQQKQNMKNMQHDQKILVAYFSATGTTARAAEMLAETAGGVIFTIIPALQYTNADLDWHDRRSRSSIEMNDPQARPEIEASKEDVADYDIIFIGYPIWWDLAPRIINTFIEKYDMNGKILIPFATSGGSGIAHSAAALKSTYPDLNWKEGRLLNNASEKNIREWIGGMGL